MDICCTQFGNSTVQFKPDCYSWCTLNASVPGTFFDLVTSFGNCLLHLNSTYDTGGMLCRDASNGTTMSGNSGTGVRADAKVGLLALLCAGLAVSGLVGAL